MNATIMICIVVALVAFSQAFLKKGVLLSGCTNINSNLIKTPVALYVSLGLILFAVAILLWLAICSRLDFTSAYPCSACAPFL